MSIKKTRLNETTLSTRSNSSRKMRLDSLIMGSTSLVEERLQQLSVDTAYSRYLQSLAKERLLRIQNEESETAIDEQLTNFYEEIQGKIDETEINECRIKEFSKLEELFAKVQMLIDVFKKEQSDTDTEKLVEQLNEKLKVIANKVEVHGLKYDDNSNKLTAVVQKLLSDSNEILQKFDEDLFENFEKVKIIIELLKKLNYIQRDIEHNQRDVNKLVIEAASLQFLKNN